MAQPPRRLMRSRSDRMLSGTAAGIAVYLGVDPTLIRLGFVIGGFFSGGLVVLAYIVAWILMPEADEAPPA